MGSLFLRLGLDLTLFRVDTAGNWTQKQHTRSEFQRRCNFIEFEASLQDVRSNHATLRRHFPVELKRSGRGWGWVWGWGCCWELNTEATRCDWLMAEAHRWARLSWLRRWHWWPSFSRNRLSLISVSRHLLSVWFYTADSYSSHIFLLSLIHAEAFSCSGHRRCSQADQIPLKTYIHPTLNWNCIWMWICL